VVTADAAHVAAVAEALATYDGYPGEGFAYLSRATVAVETLTPLIRAQAAAMLTPGVTGAILAAYGLGRDDEAAHLPVRKPESIVATVTAEATP
jgi:hypothetical protein